MFGKHVGKTQNMFLENIAKTQNKFGKYFAKHVIEKTMEFHYRRENTS